jgi:hypothetical protein
MNQEMRKSYITLKKKKQLMRLFLKNPKNQNLPKKNQ